MIVLVTDLRPPTNLSVVLSNETLTAHVSFDVIELTRGIGNLYSGIMLQITLPNKTISSILLTYPAGRKFNVSLTSAQFGQHEFKLLLMFNTTVNKSRSVAQNRGMFTHVAYFRKTIFLNTIKMYNFVLRQYLEQSA